MALVTKKRGRLVIDFYDQHGRRRLKTLPLGTSKKDARRVLREIEAQVERGVYLPRSRVPTFAKVAEEWLKYKKPSLRASTWIQYEGHVSNYLVPYFGNTRINAINFNAAEKYVQHLSENLVTAAMVKKLLTTLSSIMRYAVRRRLCEHNPIPEIERPRIRNTKSADILRPDELRALIGSAGNQEFQTLLIVAGLTGMRQGEILGLEWGDIDWHNLQIHVRRTFNHGGFHEPKSEASRRAIDVGKVVIEELKAWKLACPPNELDLVFPNNVGKPMDAYGLLRRHFQRALRKSGLRKIRFHDLRHTYASLLIDQGEHPKYIQTQMGHSSINITMDTYGHLMKTVNREASRRLEKAVFGEDGDFLETKRATGHSLQP